MSINIIGAGLAGLSAALTLAEQGIKSNLISAQQSERAQSVMAEGGINACLNTMGESDKIEYHYEDTMRGGVFLSDPNSVKGLCETAPSIVKKFERLGVPFEHNKNGIIQRNFGGQKKKRTAYVKSSTGKMLMTALIDEVRKYEAQGLVTRYANHRFLRLIINDNRCCGAVIQNIYTNEILTFGGSVILATGGLNGLFDGLTTGTTQNTSDAAAAVFAQGVELANLEMIQYHPTTIQIQGKRLLISEAARGEGGRLFIKRNGKPWYFMEEKYPELKNLMPPLFKPRPGKGADSCLARNPLLYGWYPGRCGTPYVNGKSLRVGRVRLSVSRRKPLGRQFAFRRGVRRSGRGTNLDYGSKGI